MLHNGIKYCAVLATLSLISAAACSDDETTTTTTQSTTTSSSTTTGGGAGGDDTLAQCTDACNTLYECGLEMDGGSQLCPGFSGVSEEQTAFVGDAMSGCVESCLGLTALINLVDGNDCPGTIQSISGANATFGDVCQNGFSGAGGAGGGTGGAAAGGAGGA